MKKKQKKCGRKSVSMRSSGKEQENKGLVFNFSVMINTRSSRPIGKLFFWFCKTGEPVGIPTRGKER